MNLKAIDLYLRQLREGKRAKSHVDDADIADYLEDIKRKDEQKFIDYINSLPPKLKAETFIELPTVFQIDLILKSAPEDLAAVIEELESDDATDVMLAVAKADEEKEDTVFKLLSDKRQEQIEQLIYYEADEAGSIMQTELLRVRIKDSVADALGQLRQMKEKKLANIYNLFVTDEKGRLLKSIAMDDLILEDPEASIEQIADRYPVSHAVVSHDRMEHVLQTMEKYDLFSVAVVDRVGHLIGRITHDDVLDVMQSTTTKQMYGLNRVDQNEQWQEGFATTTKNRAFWLGINLVNAVLVSVVIGFFEATLDAIVALAVLMPIVANMAGTASVQTMTVAVRQMSIGEIRFNDFLPFVKKEFNVSLLNGLLFGVFSFAVAQVWFDKWLISVTMGLSMFVSFVSAGLLGSLIPVAVKKANFDPAVASSVIVITLVDVIGFFSFLWFSTLIVI